MVKSCDYVEDADVSKLCGSGPLHLVSCPGCFPSQYMYTVVILCTLCHKCSVQSFVMMTGEGQEQFKCRLISKSKSVMTINFKSTCIIINKNNFCDQGKFESMRVKLANYISLCGSCD